MHTSKKVVRRLILKLAQDMWCDCYVVALVVIKLLPESYELIQGRQRTLPAALSRIACSWDLAESLHYRWLIEPGQQPRLIWTSNPSLQPPEHSYGYYEQIPIQK